jgi:hypothetical protein
MKPINIKVKIEHSKSIYAWNILSMSTGTKYKIAIIPYSQNNKKGNGFLNIKAKAEALEHAEWICFCFNFKNVNEIKTM